MVSTTNPAGIKDDNRKFLIMMLIPLGKQRHASTQNHRM
jgi:hypothetical protein